MELTKQQVDIINSTGNIKINAVAGSGKTTTIIEYANARPKNSKILYLAFNRSVKLEATKKFKERGLSNVQVETAHSLAYKAVVFRHNYKVRHQGYKTHEIAELLHLEGNGEKLAEFVIANHINKFITYFCNSDKLKIQDLNYLEVVADEKAKSFVTTFYHYIEQNTRLLLSKMDKGEIEIIHDFYLKKFQLAQPKLAYDYILFDEGQDASPTMLDVFFKQDATKVIVGDSHQQIYGWRYAVNSLEKSDFKTYQLSTSFRFGQDIANLGMEVLNWKKHLFEYESVSITGKGTTKEHKTKAVLARTNLGLLLKAIEYITEKKRIKHIYFEGNINSYTYADEGASLYDILHLYNGKHRLIKDRLIRYMSKQLGRTKGAIWSRIKKLELVELYG
ncbi:MAG: UvrD-helicase domain-containing protein [Prolixibacteraceae bacterium]